MQAFGEGGASDGRGPVRLVRAGASGNARPRKASIDGKLGAVLGKAQGDDERWSYGVFVYDEREVWSCWEDELVPTGEFDRRESVYGGESIRVSKRGELLG